MGAGKTTLGVELARRIGRACVDVDREIERESGATIAQLFEQTGGETAFRVREALATVAALRSRPAKVLVLGGGAVQSEDVRRALRENALTILVPVDVDLAWERVRGSGRPLGQDELEFRTLFRVRRPLYDQVADARAEDVDGAVLDAGAVTVEPQAISRLGELVPGGDVALVADAHVAGIHGADAQVALARRLQSTHDVPAGEAAKSYDVVARLWSELRLDRGGTVVALGGGATTDVVGFAAATYLRGIGWVPVPTTLVGQVDAAIGGKTAIDVPEGKNLVGAFHWPARTVIDPALLETLPERERRNGLAEVVKSGLLAGEELWALPETQLVRRCAAFKTAVCLRDPHDRDERRVLNLGHTFAHALEAAAEFELPHGEAVALGLLAALRLSGLDTRVVEETLSPRPVRVDRERAWAALRRDKKAEHGRVKLVLLERPGVPRVGVDLPEREVRAVLDDLIVD